ncbi:MAG: ureidoglycolate lyase [Ilumatobacter sp.]
MNTPNTQTVRELVIDELTSEAFASFGTVVAPQPDGTPFGSGDASLELSGGTPRLYTMQIPGRGLAFHVITHHKRVTQALGSAGGHEWFVAVAPPGELDAERIRAFRIPADTAIVLYAGTWHAGPLFEGDDRSFFNLELSDTNEVDHHSIDLAERDGMSLQLVANP